MGKRREYYERLMIERPAELGRLLGYEDLTPTNNKWIRSFILNSRDQTLQASRGTYKTSCLGIAIAIMLILYDDKRLIFFRKTDTDVAEVLRSVSNILKHGAMQQTVMGFCGEPIELIKDTANEIDTTYKKGVSGSSQLLGLGITTSITGKHGDIIITDDIVNLYDRVSKAEREKTKRQYMELENVKNRGGRFINAGTPWHKEDAFTLMDNITRYDCYSLPEIITAEELTKLRTKMTPSLFAANYELKHIAESDVIFDNAKFYEPPKDDVETIDPLAVIYNGIGHIDAGYGGKDGTAFTVIKERDGKLYAYGRRWDKHVDDCLEDIYEIANSLKTGTIHMEKNADKGYLKKKIDKVHPASDYHESTNKYIKITTWLRASWDDVYFMPGTDPEYINEILEYNEQAEHDDAPDSLASIIRELRGKGDWLY